MSAILNSPRYSMKQVARLLGVHTATIWRWQLTGVRGCRLRTVLVGARRYVLAADLDAFLAANNQEPRHDPKGQIIPALPATPTCKVISGSSAPTTPRCS